MDGEKLLKTILKGMGLEIVMYENDYWFYADSVQGVMRVGGHEVDACVTEYKGRKIVSRDDLNHLLREEYYDHILSSVDSAIEMLEGLEELQDELYDLQKRITKVREDVSSDIWGYK